MGSSPITGFMKYLPSILSFLWLSFWVCLGGFFSYMGYKLKEPTIILQGVVFSMLIAIMGVNMIVYPVCRFLENYFSQEKRQLKNNSPIVITILDKDFNQIDNNISQKRQLK